MYYQKIIPQTSMDQYISGRYALNIPSETSGDWHFTSVWLSNYPETVELFGKGQRIDTTEILGDFGIADRKDKVILTKLKVTTEKVFVADHYRAILDLALSGAERGNMSLVIGSTMDFLDTEEQKTFLLDKARELLNNKQTSKLQKTFLNKWIIKESQKVYRGVAY